MIEVLSGLPQWSVVDPLLLIIYINDLPSHLVNVTKLYADDTKLLSDIVTEVSALNLQRFLDSAFNWTQDWLIKFNINKCTVMHYGHNNEKRHFFL